MVKDGYQIVHENFSSRPKIETTFLTFIKKGFLNESFNVSGEVMLKTFVELEG